MNGFAGLDACCALQARVLLDGALVKPKGGVDKGTQFARN